MQNALFEWLAQRQIWGEQSMKRIALVGDFKLDVTAHQAIPKALQLAADQLSIDVRPVWVHTEDVGTSDLASYDGIWCVPASPYASMDGALQAIRYARENGVPFLGTCGGYQHAALEYARNVLGEPSAGNAEVDANTSMPLISALVCKLVEKSGRIRFLGDSKVAEIYAVTEVDEEYHCSFGVNRDYLPLFEHSALQFTGFDLDGDPRVLEIREHPFFMGTAFQPERSALLGENHALITAFVQAAAR